MPKKIEQMAMYFPFIHLLVIATAAFLFLRTLSVASFMVLLTGVYILPVALWRWLQLIYPLPEGNSFIGRREPHGNPWILAHRLQYLFITFPFLERLLIVIPAAFSAWLRLWGSQIGKNVVWTPRVEILDRTHLDIGNSSFIGDKAYLSAHLIKRKGNRLVLLLRKITIGERALIGYGSHLGPGSIIPADLPLPALSKAMLGKIEKGVDGIKNSP